MKEIVRQVTIDCEERGTLLQKLIDGYVDVLERAIVELNKEKLLKERESFEKERFLHRTYMQRLAQQKSEIQLHIGKEQLSKTLIESHEKELLYLKKKDKKLTTEFEKLKLEIKSIQQDFAGILKENSELKVFYEETLYVQKYEADNRAPIDDEMLKKFRDGVFGRLDDVHSSK